MSFFNAFELKVLDHIFKNTALSQPTNINVALSTANPGEDGGGLAEPVGNGYERVTHNNWTPAATEDGMGEVANDGDVTFPEATGNWGEITHVAWFDGSAMLGYAELETAKSFTAGDVARFPSGTLKFRLD